MYQNHYQQQNQVPPGGAYPPPPPPPPQGYYQGYVSPPGYGYPVYMPPMPTKETLAKKVLRRHANGLGAGLLLVEVLGAVVALALPFLMELIFPGSMEQGGFYYDAFIYAWYSPIAILLSMWIGMKICKEKLSDVTPFGKCKPFLWFSCILFSFFFVFAGNVIGDIASFLSPSTAENMTAAMGNNPQTLFQLAVDVLKTAAIPALVEELAFRGIALGSLRKFGDRFAIVMSSLLFGLLHGNLIQVPFAFCVGLVMAYTVVRTGSIVPAVIIHFINNSMSCLLSYFGSDLSDEKSVILYFAMYGIWLALGILGFVLLRFGCKEPLSACFEPYHGCLTPGVRNRTFIFSGAMIAAILIYLASIGLFAIPGVM